MKRLIGIILVFFSICSFSDTPKTHIIETRNKADSDSMVFTPSFIKIKLGDKVKFVPKDEGHNSQSVFTPKKASSWKTKPGKMEIVTFDQEGVYIFECINHFIMGMNGVIQVGDAKNLAEAKEFLDEYKKKIVINKHRIDKSFNKIK